MLIRQYFRLVEEIFNLTMINLDKYDGQGYRKIFNLINKCLDYFIINDIIINVT